MREPGSTNYQRRSLAIGLRHLRFAVLASDCGSLRRAAELLTIQHSALSRSIGQLEHLVGTALFERSSGGVKPTLAGRDVLRTARLVLKQVDSLVETGRSFGSGEAGRITIALCTSISAGNLRATLVDFKKRFPQIQLAIFERSHARLLTSLQCGSVDIVISPGSVLSADNKVLSLWSERILVSLPDYHALASREVVYWTDLRNETVLLSRHDPGQELEDLLVSKLLSSEDRPKIEWHDVSRGIIKGLVNMGFGISIVLESDSASFAGLAYRELRDEMSASRIGFCAHWRSDNENPALNKLLNLLAERYSSLVPSFRE
ncbi:DNA-binding transcriptional LysR family regulator [Bradyrhizobium elkanii]|uniref:LysR substrate-binding domain-containing protein n=1 Tax=Bradyrhizobium elkanii TaxID=29448 RepID=UPI0035197942